MQFSLNVAYIYRLVCVAFLIKCSVYGMSIKTTVYTATYRPTAVDQVARLLWARSSPVIFKQFKYWYLELLLLHRPICMKLVYVTTVTDEFNDISVI